MRIQFASDLYLESRSIAFEEILEPVAPILLLVGNIASLNSTEILLFFKWASKRWNRIFWLPGALEMDIVWTQKKWQYHEALQAMKTIADTWPNIFVMNREKWISEDGILFLSTPLWKIQYEFNESKRKSSMSSLHQQELAWLEKEIRSTDLPTVVCTTYAPTYTLLHPTELQTPQTTLYASDLERLIRPPIVAWICGYIHQAVQVLRPWNDATGNSGNVLLTTNPLGYPFERTGYRKDAVLRIGSV
jgi:hypothetical protein